MRTLTVASIVVFFGLSASGFAQGQSSDGFGTPAQRKCAMAAFTDYNKTNVGMLLQAAPVASVDQMVSQRRLQEQYCSRFSECFVTDQKSVPFRIMFSQCLARETLEQYDAKPRSDD